MRPRRSILSVPGHIEKFHHKACSSDVDVVMLDLEDSVPVAEKDSARRSLINSLLNLDWKGKTLTVRVNGLDTPFAYRDLVEVVEGAGHLLDSIVIPKVDNAGDVAFVSRMLDGIEMNKELKNRIKIEVSIESAPGMLNINEIAKASDRVISLVFGIADYSASIGARLVSISGHGEKEEDIYPGHRWNYALSTIVNTAKANGLMAIDATYGSFRDLDGLKKSATMGCALGCDGKWAIHPDQIGIINQVFSPSEEDIARAAKIIEAHNNCTQEGKGAVAVDGRMVDHATIRMARQLWEHAKSLKLVY